MGWVWKKDHNWLLVSAKRIIVLPPKSTTTMQQAINYLTLLVLPFVIALLVFLSFEKNQALYLAGATVFSFYFFIILFCTFIKELKLIFNKEWIRHTSTKKHPNRFSWSGCFLFISFLVIYYFRCQYSYVSLFKDCFLLFFLSSLFLE